MMYHQNKYVCDTRKTFDHAQRIGIAAFITPKIVEECERGNIKRWNDNDALYLKQSSVGALLKKLNGILFSILTSSSAILLLACVLNIIICYKFYVFKKIAENRSLLAAIYLFIRLDTTGKFLYFFWKRRARSLDSKYAFESFLCGCSTNDAF